MISTIVVFDCTDLKRGRAIAAIASAAAGPASEVALFVNRWRPAGEWADDDSQWDDGREGVMKCDVLLLHSGNRAEFKKSGLLADTTILYSLGGMVAQQMAEIWIDREVGPEAGLPTRAEMRAIISWIEGGKRLAMVPEVLTVAGNQRREALMTLSLLCGGYLLALDPQSCSQEVRDGVSEVEEDVPQQLRVNARRSRELTTQTSWWTPLLGNQSYRLSGEDGSFVGEFVAVLDEHCGSLSDASLELLVRAWREASAALRG